MKRLLAVALVMAVLLVGAPWVIGNVAEERVNRSLDALVEAAPYLGIVERKYTQGWFRSEQEVTFEVLGGVTRAFGASSRFTVRNEILHGPVLGFSGLGIARVNTKLVLDPEIRRAIAERFGTEDPIEVSTRIGFLGGGGTTISSEARHLTFGHYWASTGWDDLVIDVTWSPDFDSIVVKGDWPHYDVGNPREWGYVRVEGAVLDVDSERVKGHLYQTDAELSLDEVGMDLDSRAELSAKKVQFVVDSTDDGDFMGVATRFGTGTISGGELSARNVAFTGTHCDFTLRRLHIDTLVRMSNAVAESYRRPGSVSMLDDDILALLGHGPELIIDRIGFETKDGAAYLKGAIRLKGVNPKDLKMGSLSLIQRIDADLRFEAHQKVIESLPGGRDAMVGAVDGGLAELTGGHVVSHVEFRDGDLKINGKVAGIPGLEAPFSKEGAASPE